jgi:ATP-dependent helicase HrpA
MTGTTGPTSTATTADDLSARLADVAFTDERRLGRRLQRARRLRGAARGRELAALAQQIGRAEARVRSRAAAVPAITFPPELPVSARVDDLAAAIRDHQVVVVAGETGSGKSTQLPKICLAAGRGVRGMIGHTQPRRIAARALAERIAEETGTPLGRAVGYTIRFGDHTGPDTLVKLMTDGILLAEIARDPDLLRYDTIIIDEAHERSLNIDFLLGYLTRLLPRRPELKLIVTSATIDPDKFARHFGGAPVVEVSGRTYPVQIRYRPYGADAADDATDGADDDGADGVDDGDSADDTGGAGDGDGADGGDGKARARAPAAPRRSPAGRGGPPGASSPEVIDQPTAILRAVDELSAEAHSGDGDILIFLSGEREITDTAEALRAHLAGRAGVAGRTEVLPLYGRLSVAEQHRVFAPHSGRRIVLATNVAETSLTVPGIRYVIDPGTARISRYSPRTKVQRLPIEKISQASAGQRAGRCGRVADGICIRLYSEEDFAARPEFTDPEVARTSLASVILQMAALGLGDIATFPFLDPPDGRQITDGITVLTELGALDRSGSDVRLTATGRSLAALPVDPRLARMIVEGDRRGCLAEVLVIVAALAIQDVREYPLEERDKAVAAHSRFADPTSDFLAVLNLWHYLADRAKALSGNAFRRMCRAEYLHYLRIREWQDLHAQLSSVAAGLGMDVQASARTGERADPADDAVPARRADGPRRRRDGPATQQGRGSASVGVDRARVHTALASGLLSHIGTRIDSDRPAGTGRDRSGGRERGAGRGREYQGTRGSRFAIWPGSALSRSGAPFVLAAELVETSRLWARTVAAVDPGWIEEVGGDLLRRSYSEPRWDSRRGAVLATERVLLLGVTLVAGRTVQYDRIDPAGARELFIRHALVEGDLVTRHSFLEANQAALDEVVESERRARRHDIAIDDEALFALYDARLPPEVTSARHLDSWWRKASRSQPDLLSFTPEMLIAVGAELAPKEQYPDRFTSGGVDVELGYVFEPGSPDDGVSATIPLAVLPQLDPDAFPAQVPGLQRELAVALIRSLPKSMRRAFVPAPDFADAALQRVGEATGSLPEQLAAELTAMSGIRVSATDFDLDKVPDHLRMTFTVVNEAGREVAKGKDLAAIQASLRSDSRTAVARVSSGIERTGFREFPPAGVPREITGTAAGQSVVGYPALVAEPGGTVGIEVFTDRRDQARAMREGTRRLLVLAAEPVTDRIRSTLRRLTTSRGPSAPGTRPALSRDDLLLLSTAPHGDLAAVLDDATAAAVDALLDWAGGPAWDADAFGALAARLQPHLEPAVLDILHAAADVLRAGAEADRAIDSARRTATPGQLAELRAERDGWLRPGFVTDVGAAHLPDVARYLRALAVRAGRIADSPDRDRQRAAEIAELRAAIDLRLAALRPERRRDEDVAALRRLLAEYRVAVFAQPMRTAVPVSAKRVRSAITALRD